MPTFATDDPVRYKGKFLRSIGSFTGPAAPTSIGGEARGKVTGVDPLFGAKGRCLVGVLWADGQTSNVLDCNIERFPRKERSQQ